MENKRSTVGIVGGVCSEDTGVALETEVGLAVHRATLLHLAFNQLIVARERELHYAEEVALKLQAGGFAIRWIGTCMLHVLLSSRPISIFWRWCGNR